jgi:hypothetical protein
MRDVWLVVISYVRFPHFISGVFTNETAMRGERIGAPLFTPPHTHDLLLFPLTNHLPPFIISIANPNARLLFLSFFLPSSSQAQKKRERKKEKEIALELVSLFSLSQNFLGLYC